MALLPKALCIFAALLVICLQLSDGSVIPRMCKCWEENSKESLHPRRIQQFCVKERHDGCGIEIILTTTLPGSLDICLKPDGDQGKRLQSLWKQRNEGLTESERKACFPGKSIQRRP
ncbi:chemokine (C-X-C motif) ligand 18b [Alosa pseudoharengus]|uniref:chemokine (C-X-C motif) ligand 18b n=1 Tax=Alosa pseudoharengus TaxID=34774 RepID=UPI003F8A3A1C